MRLALRQKFSYWFHLANYKTWGLLFSPLVLYLAYVFVGSLLSQGFFSDIRNPADPTDVPTDPRGPGGGGDDPQDGPGPRRTSSQNSNLLSTSTLISSPTVSPGPVPAPQETLEVTLHTIRLLRLRLERLEESLAHPAVVANLGNLQPALLDQWEQTRLALAEARAKLAEQLASTPPTMSVRSLIPPPPESALDKFIHGTRTQPAGGPIHLGGLLLDVPDVPAVGEPTAATESSLSKYAVTAAKLAALFPETLPNEDPSLDQLSESLAARLNDPTGQYSGSDLELPEDEEPYDGGELSDNETQSIISILENLADRPFSAPGELSETESRTAFEALLDNPPAPQSEGNDTPASGKSGKEEEEWSKPENAEINRQGRRRAALAVALTLLGTGLLAWLLFDKGPDPETLTKAEELLDTWRTG